MNKHSPEPWRLEFCDGWYIVAADGVAICDVGDRYPAGSDLEQWQETGNRIVACVNALAGFPDPEKDVPDLIAVLRECRNELTDLLAHGVVMQAHIVEQAESVLAKVRG